MIAAHRQIACLNRTPNTRNHERGKECQLGRSFSRFRVFVISSYLAATAILSLSAIASQARAEEIGRYRLATFSADVTIPIGHACMGGGVAPAREIVDPLFARGVVLLGPARPLVIVAVDWCEIRNDAYDRWRQVLAEAASTVPPRVMLTSVHQHDAPVADLTAQKLLDEQGLKNSLCDPKFHEEAVQRVAKALRESLSSARPVTHIGTGQARVEGVASNRRVVGADGRPGWPRNSATTDPAVRAAPEGTIDPYLKTLSFWDGDRPVAAIHCYAVHPMSYYGRSGVSADFVGMARTKRQKDNPAIFQIYMSGCSGDVVAGKFNDGAPENRPVLADKIYRGMVEAWRATKRHPITSVNFDVVPLSLPPRATGEFTVENLRKRLADPAERTFGRNLAAMGLSWHARVAAGKPIDVPVLDLGPAQLVLLPAESFVEYQLIAQRLRPDSFVMVAGYSECAPGYIPTDESYREGFANGQEWCWVSQGAEKAMRDALARALSRSATEN